MAPIMKQIWFITVAVLLFAPLAFGANHAVRPSCANNGDGSAWSCAASPGAAGAFNTLNGLTYARGDVYFVIANGTASSPAYCTTGCTFNVANSGTSTITIQAATVANHGPSSGWNNSYQGTAQFGSPLNFNHDYWILNGVYGTPNSTGSYGIQINNTGSTYVANSTGNVQCGSPSLGYSCSNSTFENLEIFGSANVTGTYHDRGIWFGTAGTGQGVNNYLGYSYIHDTGEVPIVLDSQSGMTVEQNWIKNNQSTSAVHAEGIAIRTWGCTYPNACAYQTENLTVRWNALENIEGTAFIGDPAGSGNFGSGNWEFYGNVMFYNSQEDGGCPSSCGTVQYAAGTGQAGISLFQTYFPSGGTIYNLSNTTSFPHNNNTSVGSSTACFNPVEYGTGSGSLSGTFTIYIENHLLYDCPGSSTGATMPTTTTNASGTMTVVANCNYYNDINGSGVSDSDSCKQVISPGSSTNPFINGAQNIAGDNNYGLVADTNAWYNTSSQVAANSTDLLGNTRTSSRGAYQYQSSAQAAAPTFSPPAGTYTGTQTVTLTSITSGAIICWNTTGSPATNGAGTGASGFVQTIGVSVLLETGTSFNSAMVGSSITLSGLGTFTIASFVSSSEVTVTTAPGNFADIAYTIAGACNSGTLLSNGGTISVAQSGTYYAVAGTNALTDSSVTSATYAINNVLTYSFTGSAYGSWASTYGIACPPTCSGSITVSSLDTVEITETSNVLAPADTWGIYTGFGGACTGFVWCFVPMNAGPQTVTGGFISQPLLPQTWVNNQEWVGGYTETVNFPSGWPCGATNYGPYTAASQTSLAQAVADAETCRKNTGFGTRINIPKALYSGSAGIVLPQTAGDTATTFIVLASSTLLPAGQTVLSHGIQDNIPESIQPGLRNPFGDGTRMSYQTNYTANNLYTLTTTTSAITAGTGVYVGVVSTTGMSLTNGDPRLGVDWGLNHEAVTIIAIPSSATCTANSVTFPCVQATFAYNHASGTDITAPVGAFTFANGTVSNTANFNDEASMPDIEYTAGNQGISVGTGSDESPAHNFAVINLHVFPTPCAYTPSPTAPACTGGNTTTLSEITTSNALTVSGTSSVSQLPNHIHFLGIYLSADFTDTTAAGYPVGLNSIVNGLDMPTCLYCSEMFSYHDRLLYPGAEGHQIQLGYSITIKLARNWLEGESSGRFCGGYGAALLLTTVSMCTDVEFRGNRSTYPLSWMQAYANGKHVNNGSASFVRKNASETKVADRFLDDGNILENIDESGAQAGQPWSAKVSANNAANGWMSTTNLTLTNNVMRNGCNGPDWGDSGSTVVGFGGGNSLGVSGVWVVNNLIYNMGDNSVGCAGTSTNKLFAYAPSINLFPTCAMTSGASTNPDGTTPVAGSCTAITNGLQLDLYNGWPIALNNCTDATFNSPLTAIGPLAYNTTPTSLTFSANIPGATLGATGVNCQFGQGTGSPFFVTVAHNTFIGAGSGSAIYLACLYTSYEPGTGTPKNIAYFARNSTIVNNLCVENSTKTSLGNQGFSGVNEGTSVENVISDANTMLFYKDAIAGRAAHGIVNCAVAGATNTCTVTSGDAPNIWSGAIVGKNTLINGVPYGPVESGPTSTTFRITTANGPGVVTGATWLFAQYTEYGGVNNAISPPRTITFPDGTSCISNDPTLTLYGDGVPSCIGIFGAMSTTNYPLALTDFNLYRLCLATDAGCNNKASLYGAGQTYQATDGTDMGANIPTILNEQVINIYTCSSPCGSGPYPDYAPSAVGSFTLGVKATPGVVLTQ